MTNASTQHQVHGTGEKKKLTAGDRESAAKIPTPAATKPWADLPAKPDIQKEPRDKTVLACALKLLRERGRDGATLDEIKTSFKEINLYHHDPKALLVWASKNRGWGFHMKQDGRIVLLTK
jgi:hypothetical protein